MNTTARGRWRSSRPSGGDWSRATVNAPDLTPRPRSRHRHAHRGRNWVRKADTTITQARSALSELDRLASGGTDGATLGGTEALA